MNILNYFNNMIYIKISNVEKISLSYNSDSDMEYNILFSIGTNDIKSIKNKIQQIKTNNNIKYIKLLLKSTFGNDFFGIIETLYINEFDLQYINEYSINYNIEKYNLILKAKTIDIKNII